jgi:hypothetical protein
MPGWWPPRWRPGRRSLLVVIGAAVVAATALALVTSHGHPRHVPRGQLPSAQPPTRMFAGVPVGSARTDLFVGGASIWAFAPCY